MKNFFLAFVALALLLVGASSCEKGFGVDPVDAEGTPIGHDMIVLGSKLEDPYSVENVSAAIASLYPTKADRVPVTPTDLYVRFLPTDEEQYATLEKAGVVMLDHPVDYQIVREGDYYHDPEIAEEDITWQYAVVSKDFHFPQDIEYEILESCYLSENDPATRSGSDGIDWDAVERESFRLTGNADMLLPETRSSKETPQGRITIEDPKISDEPFGVKGVRVACNIFVKFAHGYTDEDGYYTMSKSFKGKPRYRLIFKNKYGFCQGFNFILVPASISTLGKHEPTGVDVNVTEDTEGKIFSRCVINNAGYDYYKMCEESGGAIKTPPSNLRIWIFRKTHKSSSVMLRHGAIVNWNKLSEYVGEYIKILKIFLPDLTVGLKDATDYESIYSLVMHEMAHASHYMSVSNDYWNKYASFVITSFITSGFVTYGTGTEADHGYCEVGEMWAYYMQTVMHNDRYPDSKAVYGTSFWFSPQIFLYMDERGLTREKIFAALTPDVTDKYILQKKLISLYPEFKTTINQAYARYVQ